MAMSAASYNPREHFPRQYRQQRPYL